MITDYKSIKNELKEVGIESSGLSDEAINTALLIKILKQLYEMTGKDPLA